MAFVNFEQDVSLAVIPTSYQLVSEGVQRRMRGFHQQAIVKINADAKRRFAAAIERREHSATVGDGPLGRSRVSGNFTFGSDLTFIGRLLPPSKTVQGFGYPDEQRADDRTEKVWRFLEEGATYTKWPSRAIFFDGGGFYGPDPNRNQDIVVPGRGGAVKFQTKEIAPRHYIRDAVESVRTNYLEPAYERALKEAMKDA